MRENIKELIKKSFIQIPSQEWAKLGFSFFLSNHRLWVITLITFFFFLSFKKSFNFLIQSDKSFNLTVEKQT